MKTTKHPRELTDGEAEAIVDEFVAASDDVVTGADALAEPPPQPQLGEKPKARIEAAALQAHHNGASWGVIGALLGMTRQGAPQRFEPLTLD